MSSVMPLPHPEAWMTRDGRRAHLTHVVEMIGPLLHRISAFAGTVDGWPSSQIWLGDGHVFRDVSDFDLVTRLTDHDKTKEKGGKH